MRLRALRGFACAAGWVIATTLPGITLAQVAPWTSNPWASRPGSVVFQSSNPYSRRDLGQRTALERYWESQRQSQQQSAQARSSARFGDYGGYYTQTAVARPADPTYSYPAGPGAYDDPNLLDLNYEYRYDLVDPLDFGNLCSNHSASDCLDDLSRSGRR